MRADHPHAGDPRRGRHADPTARLGTPGHAPRCLPDPLPGLAPRDAQRARGPPGRRGHDRLAADVGGGTPVRRSLTRSTRPAPGRPVDRSGPGPPARPNFQRRRADRARIARSTVSLWLLGQDARERQGARLERRGLGEEVERGPLVAAGQDHAVAGEGAQLGEQRCGSRGRAGRRACGGAGPWRGRPRSAPAGPPRRSARAVPRPGTGAAPRHARGATGRRPRAGTGTGAPAPGPRASGGWDAPRARSS